MRGGLLAWLVARASAHVGCVVADTVEYFAERGHDNCQPANPTSCVMKMVTPKVSTRLGVLAVICGHVDAHPCHVQVKAVTQSYFGCTNANLGAELENQPTTPCTMIGSHWEARLFMTATMAAFTTPNPKLLPMTLALFEDSGWYKANYSMANRLQVCRWCFVVFRRPNSCSQSW